MTGTMVMDAALTTFVMRGTVPDIAVEAATGGTREIVSGLVIGMLLPPLGGGARTRGR